MAGKSSGKKSRLSGSRGAADDRNAKRHKSYSIKQFLQPAPRPPPERVADQRDSSEEPDDHLPSQTPAGGLLQATAAVAAGPQYTMPTVAGAKLQTSLLRSLQHRFATQQALETPAGLAAAAAGSRQQQQPPHPAGFATQQQQRDEGLAEVEEEEEEEDDFQIFSQLAYEPGFLSQRPPDVGSDAAGGLAAAATDTSQQASQTQLPPHCSQLGVVPSVAKAGACIATDAAAAAATTADAAAGEEAAEGAEDEQDWVGSQLLSQQQQQGEALRRASGQRMFPMFRRRENLKKLYIVRHGESTYNAAMHARGSSWADPQIYDAQLTEKGRQQARALREQLTALNLPPDTLWLTSPLARAMQTFLLACPHAHLLSKGSACDNASGSGSAGSFENSSSAPNGGGSSGGQRPPDVLVLHTITEKVLTCGDIGHPASELRRQFPQLDLPLAALPELWWHSRPAKPNCALQQCFGSIETKDQVLSRIGAFRRWLQERPESVIVAVGHSSYWRSFEEAFPALNARNSLSCRLSAAMQALATSPTASACRAPLVVRSATTCVPLQRWRHRGRLAAAPPPPPARHFQQQQPQQLARQQRAVATQAFLSAETLVGLAIFFSPSVAALIYAYVKGKGNIGDGLSRLLTDVSQGYFQPDVGGKNIPVAQGELSDLAGDEPLFKALYKWFIESGGVFKLEFGPKAFIVISDPLVVRHLLKENHLNYDKGVLAEILEPIMGKGLIPADLETWKVRRRAIVPGFHKAYLDACVAMFGRVTLHTASKLEAATAAGPAELDMETEFLNLGLDIIGLGVFNYDFGSITTESPVIKAVYGVLKEAEHRSTFYIPYWNLPLTKFLVPRQRQFNADLAVINQCLNELIEQAKNTRQVDDIEALQARDYSKVKDASLLRFLVDMRDADLEAKQMRDDLMTMLIAGHETTAAVCTWTLFCLMQDQRVEAKVLAEVDAVIGDRVPVWEDFAALPYTRMVVAEAMRLAIGDDVLPPGLNGDPNGYPIGKGADLFISLWNLHRSPHLWKDPDTFRPERFTERFENAGFGGRWAGYNPASQGSSLYPNEVSSDFAFLPFGGGARKCIGDQFAITEACVALVMLLRRFRFTLKDPKAVGMATGATIHTANGLKVTVERRGKPAEAVCHYGSLGGGRPLLSANVAVSAIMKGKGLSRREVLLPGSLLPQGRRCEGLHHGVVLRLEAPAAPGGTPTAVVQMTDFYEPNSRTRKLKVPLPVTTVQPFVQAKQPSASKAKRMAAMQAKEEEWEKAAGVNYSIARWSALDRERAPKKARRAPDAPPLHGPQLLQRLAELQAAPPSQRYPPGTRLWVRVPGSGMWPGVAWSFALCKRRDWGQLLLSHRPGLLLVRYYGEHSSMYVREEDCELPPADESEHLAQLKAVARQQNKVRLLELALSELEAAHSDPELERRRMARQYEMYLQTRQAPDNCYLCLELGAELQCVSCDRLFHPLCLSYPAVSRAELPGGVWTCPCCAEEQPAKEVGAGGGEAGGGEGGAGEVERMGLTPDWLIEAAAFRVFDLERPTAARPFIAGLLDPCTNSKLAPNIPAEKLYDKQDNGLKLSNSWAGFFVLLNPDYSAQVQWRFVNRAIDEVESGQVPGVVLVCRNSTDTGYFQRLRPYPRTPIGFGIAVFCIAKHNVRELYTRFFDAFESMGEPNIPVDRQLMQTDQFFSLLDRLRRYAAEHQRDNWVQCTKPDCGKWRIVDFRTAQQIGEDTEWSCDMLRPPFTSCQTPLSRGETIGGHYAAGGADWVMHGDEEAEERGGAGQGLQSDGADGLAVANSREAVDVLASAQDLVAGGTHSKFAAAEEAAAAAAPASPSAAAAGCVGVETPALAADGAGRRVQVSSGSDSEQGANAAEGQQAQQAQQMLQASVPGQLPALASQETSSQAAPASPQLLGSWELASSGSLAATSAELPPPTSHMLAVEPGRVPPAPPPPLAWLLPAAAQTQLEAPALPADVMAAFAAGSQQQQQAEAAPPSAVVVPHPLPPASQVVCSTTLQELIWLPPRNLTLEGEQDGTGDGGQVLTALELARQARIAANRAYLAGLGLGAGAMKSGQVPPLAPTDPVILAAARELASRAAEEQGRRQLEEVRARYDSAQRRRKQQEPRLLAALRQLVTDEQTAWRQLTEAEHAASELAREQQLAEARGQSGGGDEVLV
ncbi:Cytochrome P450 97B2 [Chlorella vulgaris]